MLFEKTFCVRLARNETDDRTASGTLLLSSLCEVRLNSVRLRTVRLSTFLAGWLLVGLIAPVVVRGQSADSDKVEAERFFETKVRPLLIERCVECHGPDEQSGELRLDREVDFRRGGSAGPLVQGRDPDASRLIRAVSYRDNDLQMPPDSKLPDEEIAILTEWVRRGASWPKDQSPENAESSLEISMADQIESQRDSHWSYLPIVGAEPPSIDSVVSSLSPDDANGIDAATITPIDRFALAKLSEAGLLPNPRADRRVLIHRAYFALLGLPPSYEEVQVFLNDDQPDAFARLLDRLLDNPHYGERWARHWLDIARYGDTKGYLPGSQETRYPFAFTYRDYVIDAFNDDKPFNEFIVEQLAADQLELEGEDRKALAAMGFLTVGRRFMNREADIIDDQIDVITRGFLGLSVSCARCHDHKYDPVPTADYYSLYGVFASSEQPKELPLLSEPQSSPEYDAFVEAKAAKQKEVDDWVEERRVETENELRSKVADYLVSIVNSLPQYRQGDADKSVFQGKRGPLRRAAVRRWQRFLVNPADSPDPIWEFLRQLAAIPVDEFSEKLPLVLEDVANKQTSGQTANTDDSNGAEKTDDHSPSHHIPNRLLAALQEAKPQSMPEAAQAFGDCLEKVYNQWVEAKKADPNLERLPEDDDERLRQVLWAPQSPTSLDSAEMIRHLDQGESNRYNQLVNGVNGIEVTHPGAPPRGMIMVDRANLVEPVIFRRGVPSNPGDQVPRRFLQVLSHVDGGQPFQHGSGRLDLAQAIASPDNPLTARVIVNRVWQHHFGEALVRTPSDFGTRGEQPTHPELLDYLAAEFMADGWSIKRLQRRIMLSSTWQQSSDLRDEAMKADPENRTLWHVPRQRLEFEPLRDRLLVAAGRLDDRVGGRSVMIHKDATRRGLYAYIDREDLPGLLASFDVPSPDASQAKRSETTVPQQALYLMNSEFVIQQAKALATRSQPTEAADSNADGAGPSRSDTEERVRRLYRYALARDPDADELGMAVEFVDPASIEAFQSRADESAADLADDDDTESGSDTPSKLGSTAESVESLDAWEQLAQVLLLSNEFAFVD